MSSVTLSFVRNVFGFVLNARPWRVIVRSLEKSFTRPSFDAGWRPSGTRLAHNHDGEKHPAPETRQAEYDRLLHRRKGLSGSEFAGMGVQFAMAVVLSAFAGVWLDKRLGTSPLFVLLLVLIGAAGGFWSMVRRLK